MVEWLQREYRELEKEWVEALIKSDSCAEQMRGRIQAVRHFRDRLSVLRKEIIGEDYDV